MRSTLPLLLLLSLSYSALGWCEKTHFAETGQINDIDFSPDRTMVVTGGSSRKVIVWNFTNLHPLSITSYSNTVTSVKFSKNQNFIAIGQSGTSTVNIISGSTFSSVTSFSTGCSSVAEVDFSWDSARLIVCGANVAEVYLTATWAKETQATNGGTAFTACRFQKNGKYGTGDANGKTNVYLAGTNTLEWSDNQGNTVTAIDFDMVNYTLISANGGGGNKYLLYPSTRWLSGTAQTVIKSTGVGSTAMTAAFSKQGSIYAIGTSSNLYIYENNTNNLLYNWTGTGSMTAGVFSYDSQYYISANSAGIAKVFKRMCLTCPAGTYESSSSCLLCSNAMIGCLHCANSSYCNSCGDGYALDTTNRNCTHCHNTMTGCVLCNSTSICTACSNLYYLTGNACTSCQTLPNCITCSSSSVCLSCNADFYLDSGTSKCFPCTSIQNCLSCFNSSACTACSNGYYLTTSTYSCTRCPQNCTECYNSTTCSQCTESYYLSSTTFSCLSCPSNCLVCSSSTTCTRCALSYYLNGSSVCMPCASSCFMCSSFTTCSNCTAGYYQSAGSCLPCSGNCLTCSSATACLSCNINYYYISATSTCSRCQNLVPMCLLCTSSGCIQCEGGFYFDGTNCLKCKQENACQTCQNATFCMSCLTGYQYVAASGTCSLCPYGCSTCTGTVCNSCLPKFYLSAGGCSLCPYNCPTCLNATSCLYCIEGFYVNTTQGCSSCPSAITNCVTCTANNYCTSCELGYMLNAANTSCTKCVWPCSLCNSTLCFQCAAGYYLSAGACLACPGACSSCNGAICTSCVNGFYLSATATCVNCQTVSTGCDNCNQSKCLSCLTKLGYYLDPVTLTCGSCSSIFNCLLCSNSTTCTLCSMGYTISASKCQLCSVSVSNCQLCNSTGCLACIDPYYLSATGCQLCSEGCTSCNDGTSCKQCAVGYIAQGTGCTYCNNLLKGCEICSSATVCTECIEGYILSGSFCRSCSSLMPGCLICSGVSTCLNCLDQYYYVSPNSCVKCDTSMPGCAFCNSSSVCLSCETGYFKDASNNCVKCSDSMCIQCSNTSTCTNCLSGYVANSTGSCQLCDSLFAGCILCSTATCLQCVSGYYVNSTNLCAKCQVNGCQVCNAATPTQCVTCSSLYFLNSTSNCVSCSLSMTGCLNCISSTSCLKCEVGLYLTATFNCQSCFSLFKGCSECTATTCNYCSGGYIMNGTTCATCISFITGCQYCTSSTVCLTCQSGYYQSASSCYSCTSITGCLDCSSATDCNLCSDEYYLSSADNLCHFCNTTVTGCVTCTSTGTCKSCLGNYALSGGVCTILKSLSAKPYKQLRLRTEYVSSTRLLHHLIVTGSSYTQASIDLTLQTVITMVGTNSSVNLTILSFEWPKNDYEVNFYTNNPLGGGFNSFFKSMPSIRLLEGEEKGRLLAASNVDLNYQFKLQMTESAIQAILPSSANTGSLSLKSTASDPQFIRSIYSQVTYSYHYIGLILTLLLFVIYLIKATVSVPDSDDQGQIVSHIFLLKCGGMVFSLAYMEYIDYCYGFLTADLPWLNNYTASLSSTSDLSPNSYLLFYSNMTLASSYLAALCLIALVALVLFIVGMCSAQKRESLKVVGTFLYNFFEVGLIIAGSMSIQGAYYNNLSTVTKNSVFYIFGILIYVLVGTVNTWMAVLNIHRINKLRIFIKATFLSLLYISPIYLLPIAMGVEIVFIFLEYQVKKATKLHPHVWVVNQAIVNLSFFVLVLLADLLLSIIFSTVLAITAILVDLFIHVREFRHQEQIIKVKQIQQLTSLLENQEKVNEKIKRRNNMLYENVRKSSSSEISEVDQHEYAEPVMANEVMNSENLIVDNPLKKSNGMYTIEEELRMSDY